jgi:hypothetical protein
VTGWSPGRVTADSDGGLVSRLSRARHAIAELVEPWVRGRRTRIRSGLFDHITTGTNR